MTMVASPLYDIRRTLNLRKPCIGREIMDAVRKFAEQTKDEYQQELVLDLDRVRTFEVGVCSESPSKDIVVRTGADLSSTVINPDETYIVVGLGTARWPGRKHLVDYDEEDCIREVEAARDGIEMLL